MSIACSCDGDYEWVYEVEDFERVSQGIGHCYGCCGTINIASDVRRIWKYEYDEQGDDNNYKILGRLCPECSGLYDSLIELGFCLEADLGFIKNAMIQYRNRDY